MATREKNYDSIKTNILVMKYCALALVIVSIILTIFGVNAFKEYCYHRDRIIPISATVTNIETVDDDGDTDYRLYVSYEYDGKIVENAELGTYDKQIAAVGENIKIRISTLNPKYIFKNKNGLVWFGFAAFIMAIALYLFTEMRHKVPEAGLEDTRLITDELVANDLKPGVSVFFSKVLLYFGGCFVAGSYVLPELFRDFSRVGGGLLLLVFMVFTIIALVSTARIPKKGYSLNIQRCIKHWSEESGDDVRYYTSFSELDKVSGMHGVCGKEYYVVLNHRKKLRKIYAIEFWQPSIEDETLHNGSVQVLKKFLTDLLVELVVVASYILVLSVLV